MICDRGGYSQKCFRYLKEKKAMYFVTYLKNRKQERKLAERAFKTYRVKTEEGKEAVYQLCEKEQRETRYGRGRGVVVLAEDGRQIPVLTNNPDIRISGYGDGRSRLSFTAQMARRELFQIYD